MDELATWILDQEKKGNSESDIKALLQQHRYSQHDIEKAFSNIHSLKVKENRVKRFSSALGFLAMFLILYGIIGFIIGLSGIFYTNLSLFEGMNINQGPVAGTLSTITTSIQLLSTTTKGMTEVLEQTRDISEGTTDFAVNFQNTLDELFIPQFSQLGADTSSLQDLKVSAASMSDSWKTVSSTLQSNLNSLNTVSLNLDSIVKEMQSLPNMLESMLTTIIPLGTFKAAANILLAYFCIIHLIIIGIGYTLLTLNKEELSLSRIN